MRRSFSWLMACASFVLVFSGCAKQKPFLATSLKPVSGFCLGGARAPRFEKRPTAEQLRDAALKLYDSFNSAAMSSELVSGPVSEPALKQGKLLIYPEYQILMKVEARSIKPDKQLVVTDVGTVRSVDWANGGRCYHMYDDADRGRVYVELPADERHSAVGSWIGLADSRYSISGLKMLADQMAEGVPCYVLQFRMVYKTALTKKPVRTVRLYLGKRDLLPRRQEVIMQTVSAGNKCQQEGGSIEMTRGFRANLKLPLSLFPTTPPRDAHSEDGADHE